MTKSTFSDQGTTILTEPMLGGNHVHYRDDVGGDEHFCSVRGSVEIWVPWKVVPLWLWVSDHKREIFDPLCFTLYV